MQFVEDNADDDGVVVTTTRHLMGVVQPSRRGFKPANQSTIWRSLDHLREVGLVTLEPASGTRIKNSHQAPCKITRVNYREYQAPSSEHASDTRIKTTHRSSRVTTEAKASPRRKRRDEGLDALLDAIRADFLTQRGIDLDVPPSGRGDLQAVRKAIGDDAEVMRLFGCFLRDHHQSVKNLNRFRSAHSKYAAKPAPPPGDYGTVPPPPGVEP